MRALILADTHIAAGRGLPQALASLVTEFDAVLHAGDFTSLEALLELQALKPTFAVSGNCDGWDIRSRISRRLTLDLDGVRVGMLHGDEGTGTALDAALVAFPEVVLDAVVFGHSHRPAVVHVVEPQPRLLANPGSALRPRFEASGTYGVLVVERGSVTAEVRRYDRL